MENLSDSNLNSFIKEYLGAIYSELADEKLKENNFTIAMHYANEAIKNDENDIRGHIIKGNIFFIQKDIINAKEEYLKCIKIDKNNLEVKIRLANIFYKLGILSYNSKDYEECLLLLTNAINYYNNNDSLYVLRARTYLKLNKIKEAFIDASVAYEINPNNQDAIEIKKYLNQY
jgi:Tfp pilus assembly protein PilF